MNSSKQSSKSIGSTLAEHGRQWNHENATGDAETEHQVESVDEQWPDRLGPKTNSKGWEEEC